MGLRSPGIEIDRELVEGLWNQFVPPAECTLGKVLDVALGSGVKHDVLLPEFPEFLGRDIGRPDQGTGDFRRGVSLGFQICRPPLDRPLVLMDSRAPDGRGVILTVRRNGGLEILFSDGRTHAAWETEQGVLGENDIHNVTVVLDGGPKIISIVVDDRLLDGATEHQFGWGRFSPHFRGINGRREASVGPGILRFWIYDRAVRVSEIIGQHRYLNAEL